MSLEEVGLEGWHVSTSPRPRWGTYNLPTGAVIQSVWMNGHGPVPPEIQGILYMSGFDVCFVPECMKCIRKYARELNCPRGREEREVFV